MGYKNLKHKQVSKAKSRSSAVTPADRAKYHPSATDEDIIFEKEYRKKHGDTGYGLATREDLEDLEDLE